MNELEVLEKILGTLERIEALLDKKVHPPHPLAAHLAAVAKVNAPKDQEKVENNDFSE